MKNLRPVSFQQFLILGLFTIIQWIGPKAEAQTHLNYGLSVPQPASFLPQSRAEYILPVVKPKVRPQTILKPAAEGQFILTSGWELIAAKKANASGKLISDAGYNSRNWYNATVPGTVLTSLVQQGVYPDPYFGLNNLHIPDSLCREDWWYRIAFTIPASQRNKMARLNLEGINYEAEVWLNGHKLGRIKGAFQETQYEVDNYIRRAGRNYLAVHIFPPPDPGIPHEESPRAGTGPNGGTLCLDGPTFISSEGWDWIPGIRDRNIGLWQNVSLQFGGPVTLNNPQIVCRLPLPDTTSAALSIGTDVHNTTAKTLHIVVKGQIERMNFQQHITLGAGESRRINFTALHLHQPRLWWPNGYGKPELYQLKLTVLDQEGRVSDVKNVRFGVREFSYELSVNEPSMGERRVEFIPVQALAGGKPIFDNVNTIKAAHGVTLSSLRPEIDPKLLPLIKDDGTAPYLVIKVNGKRIYCKGGNWGMDDAMKNTSRSHLEPYFRLHRDAHFNMVRNWTGESTEQTFYDLCDEYGLLVWNDFWLSTQGFNLNVKDDALFMANAEAVVKRFRNHPCIAVWCPRNEGYAPAELEGQLNSLLAREDMTRYYQPNSRYLNLRTSGPWNYLRDATEYAKLSNGFSTELGTPSIPTAASMKKMMAKEDLWPIGDVWYYHDFHDGQKEFVAAMDSLYGKATSLEDFCRKAQLLNYDSHRSMFESWSGKLWNNTTGLLLWMTHPAWPSTVWQTYSWDYETFGSYFASMKACEPLHVQLNPDGEVVVVNTTLQQAPDCRVALDVYDVKGQLVSHTSKTSSAAADQLTSFFHKDAEPQAEGTLLLRLSLTNSRGQLVSINDYWRNYGATKNYQALNQLPAATLTLQNLKATPHHLVFTIVNTSAVPAIAVKLNLVNTRTKAIVLPAYFSDGYFNLLPGEHKEVSVEADQLQQSVIKAESYNSLTQVFSKTSSKNQESK